MSVSNYIFFNTIEGRKTVKSITITSFCALIWQIRLGYFMTSDIFIQFEVKIETAILFSKWMERTIKSTLSQVWIVAAIQTQG